MPINSPFDSMEGLAQNISNYQKTLLNIITTQNQIETHQAPGSVHTLGRQWSRDENNPVRIVLVRELSHGGENAPGLVVDVDFCLWDPLRPLLGEQHADLEI